MLVVACWSPLLAAALVVAAVIVVRTQMPSLDDGMDRLAARGVLGVGEVLLAVAALLAFGARRLWRNGRPAMLRAPLVAMLVVALWGGIDAVVERSPSSGWVALGVLTAGGVPLALLRLPDARRWLASIPRPPAQVSARLAPWQSRLDPVAVRLLMRSQVAGLLAWLSTLVMLMSWMFGIVDGAVGGWAIACVGGVATAVAVSVRRRWQAAVRADVERAHGLPPGACRWVTLSDPVIFDKTLNRAIRLAPPGGEPVVGAHRPTAAAPE